MTDLEHQYFTSVNRHDSLASDCCLCEYGIVGWAGGGHALATMFEKVYADAAFKSPERGFFYNIDEKY